MAGTAVTGHSFCLPSCLVPLPAPAGLAPGPGAGTGARAPGRSSSPAVPQPREAPLAVGCDGVPLCHGEPSIPPQLWGPSPRLGDARAVLLGCPSSGNTGGAGGVRGPAATALTRRCGPQQPCWLCRQRRPWGSSCRRQNWPREPPDSLGQGPGAPVRSTAGSSSALGLPAALAGISPTPTGTQPWGMNREGSTGPGPAGMALNRPPGLLSHPRWGQGPL